jgi:hypothetical protein
MIKLHATKKLLSKLPVDESGYLPKSQEPGNIATTQAESPLSDWHGNIFLLQRRQCILLIHDRTRFPLFIPRLTKPDFANLDWWFMDTLMNTLIKCGANDQQLNAIHQHLAPLQIDTTRDRSVQGTMNRMKGDIEHQLWYDRVDINGVSAAGTSVWLAERPCNVKGQKDCLWPQQAMLALLERLAMNAPRISELSVASTISGGADSAANVINMEDYRNA